MGEYYLVFGSGTETYIEISSAASYKKEINGDIWHNEIVYICIIGNTNKFL